MLGKFVYDLADTGEKFGALLEDEKFVQCTRIVDGILSKNILLMEVVDRDRSNRIFDMTGLPRQIKIQDQKSKIGAGDQLIDAPGRAVQQVSRF